MSDTQLNVAQTINNQLMQILDLLRNYSNVDRLYIRLYGIAIKRRVFLLGR